MPPETQGEVVIDGHRIESSWIANKVTAGRYGADFNTIQAAIDYCDAIGGIWTIELYPYGTGVWNEGDITPGGTAIITIRGMDEHVIIAPVAAPTIAVINITDTLYLENLLIVAPDNTRPAVLVNTAAGAPTMTRCIIVGTGIGGYGLQMTQGSIDVSYSSLSGDTHLSTARCLLDCYFSTFLGDIITAAEALNHDIDLMSCELTQGNITSNATGATVIALAGCSDVDAIVNAGTGLFTILDSYVNSVSCTNVAGEIRVRGGTLNSVTRAVGAVVWWLSDYIIKVLPCDTVTDTVITWALAAAATAAHGVELRLVPGEYEEDQMNCVDDCIIVGAGHTVASGSYIRINSANTIFTCGAVQMSIRQCRIIQQGAGNCLAVNNALGVLHLDNVVFGSAGLSLAMTDGTFSVHSSTITAGNIDLRTALCTLTLHRCDISGGILTQGAFNHVITLEDCNLNGNNFFNDATGATVIGIWACFNIGAFRTDGIAPGTVTIEKSVITAATKLAGSTGVWTCRVVDFGLLSNEDATGAITCYAGLIYAITRAVGPIIWWQDTNTLKVIPCTTVTDTIIGWAIAAALAGDVILIHPGTYQELIVCKASVNIKGIGTIGSVVIYYPSGLLVTLANPVELQNLTLRLNTDSQFVSDNGVACTARMSDLIFEAVTPGVNNLRVFRISGAGDYTIERCSFNIGGTGASFTIYNDTAAATFRLIDNDFTWANVNAGHFYLNQASIFTCKGNIWGGTCFMFLAQNGTFTFDHDTMSCTGTSTAFRGIGYMRHCTIEAPIFADVSGIIRLKNCSYRAIQRTGNSSIVDESPWLSDAPWHVEKWAWMAALANLQVTVRGGAVDGGSGQVHLPVTDGAVATRSAVETLVEVAGTLGNHFTPARTPRYISQISVDDFAIAATNFKMFFGLRETLGNNVPIAGEHHAGFEWDGTNFQAVNGDAAAKQANNLTTPTNATQVQLEVIVHRQHQVEFYIGGILVHTDTLNIPTAVLDWQHLSEALGNSSATTLNVTVRNGGVQECPS